MVRVTLDLDEEEYRNFRDYAKKDMRSLRASIKVLALQGLKEKAHQ